MTRSHLMERSARIRIRLKKPWNLDGRRKASFCFLETQNRKFHRSYPGMTSPAESRLPGRETILPLESALPDQHRPNVAEQLNRRRLAARPKMGNPP